jgi:hypothetical protein
MRQLPLSVMTVPCVKARMRWSWADAEALLRNAKTHVVLLGDGLQALQQRIWMAKGTVSCPTQKTSGRPQSQYVLSSTILSTLLVICYIDVPSIFGLFVQGAMINDAANSHQKAKKAQP